MSNLATERLINRTRYLFTVFFLATGFASYKGGSDPRVYLSVISLSGVYLILGLINEIAHARKKILPGLIYASVTVDLALFFFVRYAFSFEPSTGYTMTMKEPATFAVYFLFGILNGLRFDRKLNLYYGLGGVVLHVILMILALTVGGMQFTGDPSQAFSLGTLRLASEAGKILFMLLFTFFLTVMAGFTRRSMADMERAREEATANAVAVKNLLTTVSSSAEELLEGSRELVAAVGDIGRMVSGNDGLLQEMGRLSSSVSENIDGVSGKSREQYDAASRNMSRIEELLGTLKALQQESSAQGSFAGEALRGAEENDRRLAETLAAIGEMRGRSEKIEEISRTIKDIADQTNLLSLNASIEAARAGEHGRGFAVVADEINKLAGRSAESSAQIEKIIQETVRGIAEVSRTVETMAGALGGIGDFVRQNAHFMEDLAAKTGREQEQGEQLRGETRSVHSLAEEIQTLSGRQSELTRSIVEWTGTMVDTSRKIAGTLDGLSELSGRLDARSRVLKEAMK